MTRSCPKSLLRCSFFPLILPIKGLSAPLASRFKPPVVVLPSSFSHFQSISWSLYCSRRNYSLLLPPLYMRPLFHSDRYILSFPHHIPNSPIHSFLPSWIKSFAIKKTGRYTEYLFGRLHNRNGDPMDSRLFSPVAGPFSVSKISIMVGIISLCFFLIAFFFHLYKLCKIIFDAPWHPLLCIIFPAAAFLLFVLFTCLKKELESSYLENE